jgi:hypothetical protein
MNAQLESARAVADAVLYEGYLLYPYTASALKNRMRWQFGVLMPVGYADLTEPSAFEAQLLARVHGSQPYVEIVARFLQAADPAVKRELLLHAPLASGPAELLFDIEGLRGVLQLDVQPEDEYFKLVLRLENRTNVRDGGDRSSALRDALISAHALLFAHEAELISLLDPPAEAARAAGRCKNQRVFPVLIGEPGEDAQTAGVALVSPIILYDFPRVAPQSTGETFDGTEIDELLMLSVNAMTDDEKREARATDPRAAAIVDRAEAMNARVQQSLHGTVAIGSHVRVHPKRRADAFDMFAEGRTARVRGVHDDVDGRRYVSVIFDDDPAADMHEWYGRSFFYEDDEVETVSEE